ncbi:MAG: hypothetical protein KFF72_08995 [Arthrospira sp. SH-MAG29]|nr:hypothetical protein [Arthrospira sp. SH-MAG29]MBS0016479.1 hypothetical protein [Arthrospira sp. SH-MAG29]
MKRQGILAPSGRGGMSTIMRSPTPTSRGGFTKLLLWWRTSQNHPLQAGAGLPNCCCGSQAFRGTRPYIQPPLRRDIFTLSVGRR